MDAKATGNVGPFARGGKSRVPTVAADHDCHPDATVPPVGLFLPTCDALFRYGITSQVTSDWLVDCLMRWWEGGHERCAHRTTWVINLANGPANHRRRPPGMPRMVDGAHAAGLLVRLAYDPPSHRQYKPIERCWGILANHWNGALLDSIEAVIRFAMTMPWKGRGPLVERVTTQPLRPA
jgi:Rhodopirellula transposase DDE domain